MNSSRESIATSPRRASTVNGGDRRAKAGRYYLDGAQRAIQSRRDSREADGDVQNRRVPEPAILATAQRLMRSDLSQPQ